MKAAALVQGSNGFASSVNLRLYFYAKEEFCIHLKLEKDQYCTIVCDILSYIYRMLK